MRARVEKVYMLSWNHSCWYRERAGAGAQMKEGEEQDGTTTGDQGYEIQRSGIPGEAASGYGT